MPLCHAVPLAASAKACYPHWLPTCDFLSCDHSMFFHDFYLYKSESPVWQIRAPAFRRTCLWRAVFDTLIRSDATQNDPEARKARRVTCEGAVQATATQRHSWTGGPPPSSPPPPCRPRASIAAQTSALFRKQWAYQVQEVACCLLQQHLLSVCH